MPRNGKYAQSFIWIAGKVIIMAGISIAGKVDKYGRFGIPKSVRDALGIEEGDLVEVEIQRVFKKGKQHGEIHVL